MPAPDDPAPPTGPAPALPAAPGPLPPLAPPDASPPWPRRLRDTLAFWFVLAVLGGGFLGWGLIAWPLSFLMPGPRGRRLGRRVISGGFGWLLRVMERAGIVELDLAAIEPLRGVRGAVVAPNHLSMIDVLLVASRLPEAVCIMKAGLERNPALGGGRLAGYIPNSSALHLVRGAAAEVAAGANLLVFPEGTRARDGRIGPFHPGFALVARRARAPVIPVFLESNTPYLGKGWPVWRRPDFPLRYRARLGAPVEVPADAPGGAEGFAEALRGAYARALGKALR